MPDSDQPNVSRGPGSAAAGAPLPGAAPVVLRAVPDRTILTPNLHLTPRLPRRDATAVVVLLVLAGLVAAAVLYWRASLCLCLYR